MTFALNRSGLGTTGGGVFTIGEVEPALSAVLNQTRIPIVRNYLTWDTLTDGIIANGERYTGHGFLPNLRGLPKALENKTVALLDTGAAFGTLPPYYWDAVYGNVSSFQVLSQERGIYLLPCNTKHNISVIFDDVEIPINPLDLTRVVTIGNFNNGTNRTVCANTFARQDLSKQGLDIILGDSFLRNVYALYNFGNWTTSGTGPPYVQFLGLTNSFEAWIQFDGANEARIQHWNELMEQCSLANATCNPLGDTKRGRLDSKSSAIQPPQDVDLVTELKRTYDYWYGH